MHFDWLSNTLPFPQFWHMRVEHSPRESHRMKQVRLQRALRLVVLIAAVSLPSCMHERKLVKITVDPSDAFFGAPDPDTQINFTALGSYIHPPDTRDITEQVTWTSDIPQLLTVTKGVASPTGAGCGIVNISASMKDGGNLVTGSATITIKDPNNDNCPK